MPDKNDRATEMARPSHHEDSFLSPRERSEMLRNSAQYWPGNIFVVDAVTQNVFFAGTDLLIRHTGVGLISCCG